MINRIRSSVFTRNVATLLSGSFVAQAITVGASPILTRFYAPESFAVLALFMALAAPLLPALCGRYDMAIVVAASRREGQQLFGLALWVSFVLSLTLILIAITFYQPVKTFFNADALGYWLLLVPPFLFLSSIITAFRNFSNLNEEYGVISKMAIIQAIIVTTVNIILGFNEVKTNGLLLGNLLGVFITSAWLIHHYRTVFNASNFSWGAEKYVIACKYKDFPLFSASSSFLDGLAVALPIFFLTKYYPDDIVGYYALLTRVAQAPLSFISTAISQVNIKKISDLIEANGNVTNYLKKITLGLTAIVIPPTLILINWGPELFTLVFGENWRRAGELLVILMPALSLRFVVSTLSGTLTAAGHLRLASFWQVLFLTSTFAMFTSLAPNLSVNQMFISMLALDIVLYLLYASFIWYSAKRPIKMG